jgi:SdiA-regulated protein
MIGRPRLMDGPTLLAAVGLLSGMLGAAAALAAPRLVRVTATSAFSPPSPDPSGITYDSATGRLVISDAEVEEMSIWAGKNVFETSLAGAVLRSYNVTSFTIEPTGTAFDANTGAVYFSDDDADMVFVVKPGADGLIGTADDTRTSFTTRDFGSDDPEGIAYDRINNRLFIADGFNAEIFVLRPGVNGVFDGAPPTGDDPVTHFDTNAFGATDPETVEYEEDAGTLLVLGSTGPRVVKEVTMTGTLIGQIDLSFAPLDKPAGMAYAPSSDNPAGRSLYIVNRRVDNDFDPSENDGTMVEVALSDLPPSPGPVDRRIAAGSDDAEENATGGVNLASSDLELVFDASLQTVGLRFDNVTIERGAPIAAAWVQFQAKETQSEATTLLIQGQAADQAATFTSTSGNISGRPRTSAEVSWTPPAWPSVGETGANERTPELKSVIQEIVNRPAWASRNALALIISGTGHRTARSFEGSAAGAALLHIEVAAPPTAADASETSDALTLRASGPQPGHGRLRVEFALGEGPARLELLDVTGRRVASRDVGALGPGRHALALGEALHSGVYLARLTQGGRARTMKMVVLE